MGLTDKEVHELRGKFSGIGVTIPNIYLPSNNVDLTKWSVVACDQFTSDKSYWKRVEALVGESPSTMNLIYPECFLNEVDADERISKIHNNMVSYLNSNVVLDSGAFFVLVERKTNHGTRIGLLCALDLEKYDYKTGSKSLIRPTEKTVVERLPARVKIREKATLEIPHIMVLIDDKNKTVIEPISKKKNTLEKIYDFDLMFDSGHVTGYKIDSKEDLITIFEAFHTLDKKEEYLSKYGVNDRLLFAVGDGNHSLAAAKLRWENLKRKTFSICKLINHPSRYALVELVNVYDEGLLFEPIHRVLFNCDYRNFLKQITSDLNCTSKEYESVAKLENEIANKEKNVLKIGLIHAKKFFLLTMTYKEDKLDIEIIQNFLDGYLLNNKQISIDYIHGSDVLEKLSNKDDSVGILLSCMEKTDLFKTVVKDGVLPRKTFSMGDANEKRFYLEARKIV